MEQLDLVEEEDSIRQVMAMVAEVMDLMDVEEMLEGPVLLVFASFSTGLLNYKK